MVKAFSLEACQTETSEYATEMEISYPLDNFDQYRKTIFDIPFFCHSIDCAVENIIDTCLGCGTKKNHIVTATSAYGISITKRDNRFFQLLQNTYLNLPDGIPAVWVGRCKDASSMMRCPGPDFFKEVLRQSSPHPIKHFFYGGKENIAEELKMSCRKKLGNTNVVGTFCPPFRSITDEEIVSHAEMINSAAPDILWIGISTPKQEFIAERLSLYTNVHFIITVGAAFDFYTGKVKRAPEFMQKLGLEWSYRILKEPRRLLMRYVRAVPEVIFYGIKDIAQYRIKKWGDIRLMKNHKRASLYLHVDS